MRLLIIALLPGHGLMFLIRIPFMDSVPLREGGECPPATWARDRRPGDRFRVPCSGVCKAQAHVAHLQAPLTPGDSLDRSGLSAVCGRQGPLDIPVGSRCSLPLLPVPL